MRFPQLGSPIPEIVRVGRTPVSGTPARETLNTWARSRARANASPPERWRRLIRDEGHTREQSQVGTLGPRELYLVQPPPLL